MSVANGTYTRTNLGMGDGNNYPRFFLDQVQDIVATEREGRAIYREEERVEIIMPGVAAFTKPVGRVTDEHRQRWPKEYAAFKEGFEISPEGTPLEEWSMLKRSQVLELKWLGFKTVEHLRDMDDHAIQKIGMGGRKIKELAGAFLDDAERNSLATRLASDNDRKDAEIAALRHQVEEMGKLTQQVHAELQGMRNAPSAVLTNIPGLSDPIEQAKAGHHQPAAASSLDNIGSRRKPRAAQTEASV